MSRRRKRLALGILGVGLAVAAGLGYRHLTWWDDELVDALEPLDGDHAALLQSDPKDHRLRIAMRDAGDDELWARVVDVDEEADGPLSSPGTLPLRADDDRLYLGPYRAFLRSDGSDAWVADEPLAGASSGTMRMFHVDGERLLTGVDSDEVVHVFAADARSGAALWHAEVDLGGSVSFYKLWRDQLLLAGEHGVLLDRTTGAVTARLPEIESRRVCFANDRAFYLTSEGELAELDERGAKTVLDAEFGAVLCKTPCWGLSCAPRKDEIVFAANEKRGSVPLPTTTTLVALDASSHERRWELVLAAEGPVGAQSKNRLRDFIALPDDVLPRFVPFRVGRDLVMVDVDRHVVAWRAAWMEDETGWALSYHERFYAYGNARIMTFDGNTGVAASAVDAKGVFETSGRMHIAGGRLWAHPHLSSVGLTQLDAISLAPRPGSEDSIWARAAPACGGEVELGIGPGCP